MTHVWHEAYYSTFPAIWTFAHQGNVERVIEWLRIRALHSPDQIESKMSFFGDTMDLEARGGEFNTTPLHAAVVNGHEGIVLRLIAAGADLSPHNARGDTPLIDLWKLGWERDAAIGSKLSEDILAMARMLLQFEVDVNCLCIDPQTEEPDEGCGKTALCEAVIYFPQVVGLLLANGADPELRRTHEFSRDTAMFQAIQLSDPASIQLLIQYGADVFTKDAAGDSILAFYHEDEDGNYTHRFKKTPEAEAVFQLIMAEVQRKKVLHQAKCEAFAMGKVKRLGAGSRVFALDDGLVRMICDKFCL